MFLEQRGPPFVPSFCKNDQGPYIIIISVFLLISTSGAYQILTLLDMKTKAKLNQQKIIKKITEK